VKQLVKPLPRAALWFVVFLLLAGVLATVGTVRAASGPNYTLTGYVTSVPPASPPPAGTQVDLVSRATGAVYTTSVYGTGGQFNFTSAGTGGALAPGWWGVWVPPQGNLSTPGCRLCAPVGVYPVNQTPLFSYLNATALTTVNYPVSITVNVASYTTSLSGTVKLDGAAVGGAQVELLDPQYEGFVLANNTSLTNGSYAMKVPQGVWVLRTTLPESTTYYNFTQLSVPNRNPIVLPIALSTNQISGYVKQASNGAPVPNGGNVTLWDATNSYLYSNPTPGGGYYSIGTYPAFGGGSQTFDVILSTVGYGTTSYSRSVSGSAPISQNVLVSPMTAGQRGIYDTTLNFTGINVSTGAGSLAVGTVASLGNDTVFANLPNASVGQMWAQLGLDFAHNIALPFASLTSLYAWENSSGPFFPAVQAGTAINGTTFLASVQSGNLATASSTCTSGSCGLTNSNTISLGWHQQFTLNGTLTRNSPTYSINFGFQHPTSSDTYNYTVVLPAGYALAANTVAPAQSRLVPDGPYNTWTSFTLDPLPSKTTAGTATFTIVKYSNITANVNVSVRNFAFSSANVISSAHGNYTVVVGAGQNATFSALNSTYPAGLNGTSFSWVFGDGNSSTTSQPTTNHTYSVARSTPYVGSLKVTSSGGLTNTTKFTVWVGEGPVSAVISSNATASQSRTSGGQPYLFVNWGTVLYFNASASTAKIAPGAPIPGVLSVASYLLQAKGFKATQNYSVGQGAYFGSNYTYQFLGAGVYYSSQTTIGGQPVPFKGWQYNLTLTVWDGTGQSATATLIVLVNDTQKPVASFQILNAAGKPVSTSGVVTATNLTAKVQFNGANATDPNNGSLTRYYWLVTNAGNSTVHLGVNQTTVKPYPTEWLPPQQKPYTVNLTVFDLNGNKGWTTQPLAVTVNSTTSVIMAADNLTGPSSLNSGTSYTYWVNITTGSSGSRAVALNVQVSFYLTSPSGTSRSYIAGTPGSVEFYNYTNGVVGSTPFATGTISSMAFNVTYRAVMTWSPPRTGNFVLTANVTASNEYSGSYVGGPQVVTMSITVNPNPTTQALEYVAIAVAVIAVILAIVFLYRRRTRRTTVTKTTSRSGLERSRSKSTDDDEDDES
jgi:hypothetical protein